MESNNAASENLFNKLKFFYNEGYIFNDSTVDLFKIYNINFECRNQDWRNLIKEVALTTVDLQLDTSQGKKKPSSLFLQS